MRMFDRHVRNACILAAALAFAWSAASAASSAIKPTPRAGAAAVSSGPPAIVIGFLGGFVRRTDAVHSGVQLAAHLRAAYPSGVYVGAFENSHREEAHHKILELLDTNHDGKLADDEKNRARIIIYGHSWGASETVALARELEKDSIPVYLTVQVDSVAKPGENDAQIPPNVAKAANFYQSRGFVRGESAIRAEDAAKTQILGNFRFDYASNPIRCKQYPWWDRFLMKTHIEIECDPKVWGQVESLIRAELPPAHPNG